MRVDYSWNLCPVINEEDYNRAKLALKPRELINKVTKTDTQIVTFDGNEETFVMFDWDEKAGGWRLRNKLITKVYNQEVTKECKNCNKTTKQDVNNTLTKVRCKTCQEIMSL